MAGRSTWRVIGSRITGAVPEEVRAGRSRPPDLAYTGQMRSSGQFRHAASSSFTRVGDLGDQVGGIDGGDPGVQLLAGPAQPGVSRCEFGHHRVGLGNLRERAAHGVE